MMVTYQADISPSLPPTLFGAMSLVAAAFACTFPETKGAELPEDIKDCLQGPLMKRLKNRRKHEETADPREKVEKLWIQAKNLNKQNILSAVTL